MTQGPVQVTPARSSAGQLAVTSPAALAPSASLRGSQMLAATIQAPDLLGYFYGLLSLQGDPVILKRCLNEIADRTLGMFESMLQAGYDGLGLQRGGPRDRFQFYQTKTPATWAEQRAKFPNDFIEDMADYERLKLQVANGELDVSSVPQHGISGNV